MPHATMDPRRHPGPGSGGPSQNIYYTLQPSRSQPMYPDGYGTLPSHPSRGHTDIPATHNVSSSPMPQQPSHYGTLPSQHSRLPSYNTVQQAPSQPSPPQPVGYNTMPVQRSNYGTLPSHHTATVQSAPLPQPQDNRTLPAPSLSRHTMKILQVPILVIGEDEPDTGILRGSPSPSPSPSSTISDPPSIQTSLPQAQSGAIHISASPRPGQIQGVVHSGTPPQVVPASGIYNQGIFPSAQGLPQQKFPPAGVQSQQGFPQSVMMSQGFPQSTGKPMVHAATLPHRTSTAIPSHLQQRPSPSSSPGSTTSLPATFPHPAQHHRQPLQHIQHQLPSRPSPTPSPVPQLPLQILPSPSPQPMTTALVIHDQPSKLDSFPSSNNYNTFPGTKNIGSFSQLAENPKTALGAPMGMDLPEKMRTMQEDMHRMQKQMENQFRNMNIAQPALPDTSPSFPDFPSIMPPSFAGIKPPAYSELATHASPSPSLSLSTPSLIEPDFGKIMSSDIGQPIVEDTLDSKGGKKQLKLNLDMHEFSPDEVKVRTDKNKLEVTAHHEEKDPNRITCRVFKQQYHLPENTRMSKLQYDMTPEGELKVEGTVKPRHRVKWAADTLTK